MLERRGVQVVEQHLLHLLLHLLHLAQDHAALALDVGLLQRGVLQDVGQNVHRLGHVLLEHLGVVRGLLARRVRVEVAAHVFNLLLQPSRRALGGALERHVLQEMRRAVVRGGLVTRPGVDPNPHGRGLGVRRGLRRDAHAVGERRHLRVVCFILGSSCVCLVSLSFMHNDPAWRGFVFDGRDDRVASIDRVGASRPRGAESRAARG